MNYAIDRLKTSLEYQRYKLRTKKRPSERKEIKIKIKDISDAIRIIEENLI